MTRKEALEKLEKLSEWLGDPEALKAIRVAIAALETTTPDWAKAPSWAKWWAMDEDGAAYWYALKPEKHGTVWAAKDPEDPFERAIKVPDWRESLQKRPKNNNQ